MGKMAMIVVVGLSLTMAIVSNTLTKSKKAAVENVTAFDRYTFARNIAHTGVNMILRRFDKYDTSFTNPVGRGETVKMQASLMSGKCDMSVRLPDPSAPDTLLITSRSNFMDTTYFMQVRLQRYPKPFPSVNSAVGLASYPIDFDMDGAAKIDGRNYDMNGSLNPDRSTDTNGVTVVSAAESLMIAPYASKITGDPGKIAVNPPPDPSAYINQYIDAADYVFPDGSNNSSKYGTASSPVIGYSKGEVHFGGNGVFYGILLVNGTVEFSGTFRFYGLVIAVGDSSTVEIENSAGNPQIYGSILAAGPAGSSFKLKGTADVRYSKEALTMAKYVGKLQAYRVVSWYE